MKKKLLALVLTGVLTCSMTACGTKEKTEDSAKTDVTATETPAVTGESTDEAADQKGLGTSTIVKLAEYKGLTYTPIDTTVTDAEVEEEVQYLLANSTTKKSQETATETSVVNIDYVGKKDGVAFDGGTASGQELDLGNSHYIEGFAESIVGMKVGETKDCPMTFPENYGVEELNGADVVFTITVNECWENVPAELNDEFAVSQGYENVQGLYDGMRELCEFAKKQNADTEMKTQLTAQLIEKTTFDITEEEIQYYVDQMTAELNMYASYYGYDLETYVTSASGLTMEDFEAQCREDAIYRIQTDLLQQGIAEAEGIRITEEVYDLRGKEYMDYFGYETMEAFEADYTKEMIEKQILADLAMEAIITYAVAE